MTEILIIRPQSHQLGDIICSLPMFKSLKNKFPDSRITFVGTKTNYNVNIKRLIPYVDEVILFNKEGLKEILSFVKQIRQIKYDYVIIPSTIRISSTSYLIALITRGKVKAGVKRIDEERNKLQFALDIKGEFDWRRNKVHQVNRFLDIVKGIGCGMEQDEIKKMKLNLTKDETEFGLKYINENFPNRDKLIIGFHPGGGSKENIWNVLNYYELIKKIYEQYKPYIFITSGFVDSEITDILENRLKDSGIPYVINKDLFAYKLASVLKHIKLYISNNTGVMHLASFAGVNTLSVFRKNDPEEWSPYYNNYEYVESNTFNINDIDYEEVFKKFQKIYSGF